MESMGLSAEKRTLHYSLELDFINKSRTRTKRCTCSAASASYNHQIQQQRILRDKVIVTGVSDSWSCSHAGDGDAKIFLKSETGGS
jgi:hypothetical protein